MTDHVSTSGDVEASVSRASLHGSLCISADQVEAVELSKGGDDLVALWLGDEYARVSVLGTLGDMFDVLMAATVELGRIRTARKESQGVRS